MKTKRGYHWYIMLTKKQKRQYRENVKNNPHLTINFENYINYKKNISATAWTFLYGSFVPIETPQGCKYWEKVMKRLKNS